MISPKTIRTALGETRASYPVPFLAGTGCGTALVVLILACSLTEGARFWALFGLACAILVCVTAMITFTVTRRPDLMRSQTTTIIGQALEIFGNDQIGELAKGRVERTLQSYLHSGASDAEGPVTRKKSLGRKPDHQESDDE